MKNLYLTLAFVLMPVFAFGEFQIKIGNDTTFCGDCLWQGCPLQLGTNLQIIGGVPPYHYAWSAQIYTSYTGYIFSAKDFLNDTTVSAPTFKQSCGGKWNSFTLTVTDAENNTATDTINVRFSEFGGTELDVWYYQYIGDTIKFWYIPTFGGIGYPYYRSYEWSPADDLLNPNEKYPVCVVTKPADYYITVEDSAGCRSTALACHVRVRPNEVTEPEYTDSDIPFIKDGILIWKNADNLPVIINLYSLNGIKITEVYPTTNEYSLKTNVSVPVLYEIIIGNKRYAGKYIF